MNVRRVEAITGWDMGSSGRSCECESREREPDQQAARKRAGRVGQGYRGHGSRRNSPPATGRAGPREARGGRRKTGWLTGFEPVTPGTTNLRLPEEPHQVSYRSRWKPTNPSDFHLGQLLLFRQLRRREGGKTYRFEESSNRFSGLFPTISSGADAGAAGEPATPAPHQRSRRGVEGLRDRRQGVMGPGSIGRINLADAEDFRTRWLFVFLLQQRPSSDPRPCSQGRG